MQDPALSIPTGSKQSFILTMTLLFVKEKLWEVKFTSWHCGTLKNLTPSGKFSLKQNKKNNRDLDITIAYSYEGKYQTVHETQQYFIR